MPNTKYFKNRVILKFALIIKEFFDLMNQNETLKNAGKDASQYDLSGLTLSKAC